MSKRSKSSAPTAEDKQVLELCHPRYFNPRRPYDTGLSLFTRWFFSPDGEKYRPRLDLVGVPVDGWDLNIDDEVHEYVPWVPLPWTIAATHGGAHDVYIVGSWGCGKTMAFAAVGIYYSILFPGFRFLAAAPTGWQAKLVYDNALQLMTLGDYAQEAGWEARAAKLVTKTVLSPYPYIEFYNGSKMEFMSGDKNARRILGFSGDMIVVDEAGWIDNLPETITNLASRMRGGTRGGRARLGIMWLASNALDNPEIWDLVESADGYESRALIVTGFDNVYLTLDQINRMAKRVRDSRTFYQFFMARKGGGRTKEFPSSVLKRCYDPSVDPIPDSIQIIEGDPSGILRWVEPPVPGRNYIAACDPGSKPPPTRGAGVVMVFDVTDVPDKPARLVYFNWVGDGTYAPFYEAVYEANRLYRPLFYFDATGPQGAIVELLTQMHADRDEPFPAYAMDFSGMKKLMAVVWLKQAMADGMIAMPRAIKAIWGQLSGWKAQDKKLRQDIVSALWTFASALRAFVPSMFQSEKDAEEEARTIMRRGRPRTRFMGRSAAEQLRRMRRRSRQGTVSALKREARRQREVR